MRILNKDMELAPKDRLVRGLHHLIVEREVVMKTAVLKSIFFLTLVASLSACSSGSGKLASSSSDSPAITSTTGVVDTTTTNTTSATWPFSVSGDTVAFVPVSWTEMNNYVGIRPLNNPSNPMINISLKQISNLNIYSGTVRLGYTDTNQFYYGEFSVGDGKNVDCDNCQNNGNYEAAYNYWTTINGKKTFMGYFQDQYGSIILVLEDALGSADASGSTTYSGRLYYRNFAQSVNPQSPYRKCWYIYSGPYACYSQVMHDKSSSTSIDGYTQLGSFSGVQSYKIYQ